MENKKIFVPLNKEADIDIKKEFLSNVNLDQKILSEVLKVVPILKDQNYKLEFKKKDDEGGNAIAILSMLLSKSGKEIKIPIIINNFKLKPIDTFVVDNIAYPLTTYTLKELLLDFDLFQKRNKKNVQEFKILSKLAEDYYESTVETLKKMAEECNDDYLTYIFSIYNKAFEQYNEMKKEASSYTEPIMSFIIKKRPDLNFDLYYIKTAHDTNEVQFFSEVIDAKAANLLLSTTGNDLIKLAEELNEKEEIYLKSPIKYFDGNYINSLRYDPNLIKEKKVFEFIEEGPAQVIAAGGEILTGKVFNLFQLDIKNLNLPLGQIFISSDKSYIINDKIYGKQLDIKNAQDITPDEINLNSFGVFVDFNRNIAYGPLMIKNIFKLDNNTEVYESSVFNKKIRIKKDDSIKKVIFNSNTNEIIIPSYFKWINLREALLPNEDIEEKVNKKIAETTYYFEKQAGEIRLIKYIGDNVTKSTPIRIIPTKEHLKILIDRLNFLNDSNESISQDILKGKKVYFSTNYPLINVNTNVQNDIVKEPTMVETITKYEPSVRLKIVEIIKEASDNLINFFPKLFNSYKNHSDFYHNYIHISKEADETTDSLDTIFSLGLVNDINSAIFLENIDKLKALLSYLSALKLYIRFGWEVGIKEYEINSAIDALLSIIQKLEGIKTLKLIQNNI